MKKATLHDYDKRDLYTLCATGYVAYAQARQTPDSSPDGLKPRKQGFISAAEAYLSLTCAITAQEFHCHCKGCSWGCSTRQEIITPIMMYCARNAREALGIFTKVTGSSDGFVYADMGHCFYSRERAIECYETASGEFYNCLLSLTRSWYRKANKDQNYGATQTSLKYDYVQSTTLSSLTECQNIAMIQQKRELPSGV
ncbi:hypothetical protein Clacol_008595 [Clathrus columnatus]|uniref:Uncharacterized protein n=1 Tax=Clathrus columnatus TaxID=1419009 RepID=A0AAV5APM4_9AGAM|nr:hypothetical protein Clacol_008595 [Clathrus columnatus]